MLGFSKSFSCCGHYQVCNMGRGNCFYEPIDPEIMNGCRAWLRHHTLSQQSQEKEEKLVEEQLSLFELD